MFFYSRRRGATLSAKKRIVFRASALFSLVIAPMSGARALASVPHPMMSGLLGWVPCWVPSQGQRQGRCQKPIVYFSMLERSVKMLALLVGMLGNPVRLGGQTQGAGNYAEKNCRSEGRRRTQGRGRTKRGRKEDKLAMRCGILQAALQIRAEHTASRAGELVAWGKRISGRRSRSA